MSISRRHFLKTTVAVSMGFVGLHQFLRGEGALAAAASAPEALPYGFGPLVPDAKGIFDLPAGFTYQVIGRVGEPMADGLITPGRPDGMAAFPGPEGKTIIVRNHELNPDDAENSPFGPDNSLLAALGMGRLYDAGRGVLPAPGGTSNILYDTKARRVERVELSLAGTLRNCAGGPTPWGSWITCEETVVRAGEQLERDHGYNFEVPAAMKGLVEPRALKAMGRFNHEAVAVDPASGIVYQTEDRSDGLIYRFIPAKPGALHEGGRLQALVVRDRASLDTRNWKGTTVKPGEPLAVRWIDIAEVESPKDDLREQGFAAGAARFARGEGMWFGEGVVYFACTNGGAAQKGQIWKYTPSPVEGTAGEEAQPGRLELFIEPNDGAIIENADNLTVAPWGDLIVCEDGSGAQFLVGVTPKGQIYKFARNMVSQSELAGACFSPDGSTLFVNIQGNGLTLAITGPWRAARG